MRREMWIFNSRVVTLTLIIYLLGHALFLPWCFEAVLAIADEAQLRLANGTYQKNTPLAFRLKPVILRMQI